jgi:hypothetical protein
MSTLIGLWYEYTISIYGIGRSTRSSELCLIHSHGLSYELSPSHSMMELKQHWRVVKFSGLILCESRLNRINRPSFSTDS